MIRSEMRKSSGIDGMDVVTLMELTSSAEIKPSCLRFIRTLIDKLISTSFISSYELSFVDISVFLGFVLKRISVSVVGHAAMLAAIKKYIPSLEIELNKKWKERMEDASSGSFSRNKLIPPEEHEAALSLLQMKKAAFTLVQMKRQTLDSRTANHLQELIGNKNNQTCVPPKVGAKFPIESLSDLVGQFSSCLVKVLTNSDIRQTQMRLMFPKSFVEKDINPLLKDGESPKTGIPVTLYFINSNADQNYTSYPMIYKCWGEDKSHKTYVLISGWLTFVTECKIKDGDKIKLWAFRHSVTGDLCFAITRA